MRPTIVCLIAIFSAGAFAGAAADSYNGGATLVGPATAGVIDCPTRVGGLCTNLTARTGDTIIARTCDPLLVFCYHPGFTVCVDADRNSVCGTGADSVYAHPCSGAWFEEVYQGPGGPIVVFMGHSAVPVCPPVRGTISVSVHSPLGFSNQCIDGVDNDGNGLVDWPQDAGCGDQSDDVEAPPTARYVLAGLAAS